MSINVRPILVGDRRVYEGTDFSFPAAQTIHVCTEANQWGVYERVFRMNSPVSREQIANHETVSGLSAWLLSTGALAEYPSPSDGQSPLVEGDPLSDIPQDDASRIGELGKTAGEISELRDQLAIGLRRLSDRAAEGIEENTPALDLTAHLPAVEELEQHLQQAASLVRGVRAALQEHSSRASAVAQQTRAEAVELRHRLVRIEERLSALERTVPQTSQAPLVPSQRVVTPPTAGNHTPVDVDAGLGPFRLVTASASAVSEMLLEPGMANGRLVALAKHVSVSEVRRLLPPGWALQPDVGSFDTALILVYRLQNATASASALRRAYLLVDLLATLSPFGVLDGPLHRQLQQSLALIERLLGPVSEQIQARAAWRRTVPAGDSDVAVPEMLLSDRVDLVRLLRSAAAKRVDLVDQLERTVRLFGQDAVSEANETFDISAMLQTAPDGTRTPGVEGEPESAGSAIVADMGRVALRREDTLRAQEVLRSLEEYNADIVDPRTARTEGMTERMTARVTGGMLLADQSAAELLSPQQRQFAELLTTRDQHTLGEVRILARTCGLVPLDAMRAINDWAEQRAETSGLMIDVAVIEVDEQDDTVWIDKTLQELLT